MGMVRCVFGVLGRWESVGSELFRLKSSTGAEYCLGPVRTPSSCLHVFMSSCVNLCVGRSQCVCVCAYLKLCFPTQTHEEAVTELVASEVSSHRQLPLRLYQVITHDVHTLHTMGMWCVVGQEV